MSYIHACLLVHMTPHVLLKRQLLEAIETEATEPEVRVSVDYRLYLYEAIETEATEPEVCSFGSVHRRALSPAPRACLACLSKASVASCISSFRPRVSMH